MDESYFWLVSCIAKWEAYDLVKSRIEDNRIEIDLLDLAPEGQDREDHVHDVMTRHHELVDIAGKIRDAAHSSAAMALKTMRGE